VLPGVCVATGHQTGTLERALLAAADTHTDEAKAGFVKLLREMLRVGIEGVAGIHDDVALIEKRPKLIDDRSHRRAGLHHEDDDAGPLERGRQLAHLVRGDEGVTGPVVRHEAVRLLGRAVVDDDFVAVALDVAGEVRAHHAQPDESDGAHVRCVLSSGASRSRSPGDPTAMEHGYPMRLRVGRAAHRRRMGPMCPPGSLESPPAACRTSTPTTA